MKKILTGLILFTSLNSFAAANKVDLLDCQTEFWSVHMGLINDGSTVELITSFDNGNGLTTDVYTAEIQKTHQDALATSAWALATQNANGDSAIMVRDEDDYKMSLGGFLQTLSCQEL